MQDAQKEDSLSVNPFVTGNVGTRVLRCSETVEIYMLIFIVVLLSIVKFHCAEI